MALGTAGDNPIKINLYHYMKTRSAEDISKILSNDFNFKVLITDAYSAYDTVMEKHPKALHQACLVHFRRALLDAMRLDQFVKDTKDLSDEAIQELILENLKNDNLPLSWLQPLCSFKYLLL